MGKPSVEQLTTSLSRSFLEPGMVQIGSESFMTGVHSVMTVVSDKVGGMKLDIAKGKKENSQLKDQIEGLRLRLQNYREMHADNLCK